MKRHVLVWTAATGSLLIAVSTGRSETPASDSHVQRSSRDVVQRALPYIARQTGAWIEEKKCTSCHQVPHALWAMNEARTIGLTVDQRLPEWNRWSVEFVLRDTEGSEDQTERAQTRTDELHQMLLAGSLSDLGGSQASSTARARLASLLQQGQTSDGRWKAGGQLPEQNRPTQETDEVTSMWSAFALHAATGADAFMRSLPVQAESHSTEHLVLRYLLARHQDSDAQIRKLERAIRDAQNDDGGWGWRIDGPSDALGTGQALYALSFMPVGARQKAISRAHRFLMRTQQSDGSWRVPSTLHEKHGQPYVISNDWGTEWGAIGLIRTLEP